jgi:hypothetical protein
MSISYLLVRRFGAHIRARSGQSAAATAALTAGRVPASVQSGSPGPHGLSTTTDKKALTIDDVQGLFAEARLLLADAYESKDTVYFSEDFEDAKVGVQETLDAYKAVVASAPTPEARDSIRNANDPKFRQLTEEFSTLEDELINEE